jgi:hypothetical protein
MGGTEKGRHGLGKRYVHDVICKSAGYHAGVSAKPPVHVLSGDSQSIELPPPYRAAPPAAITPSLLVSSSIPMVLVSRSV